jgi:hypothetical protein
MPLTRTGAVALRMSPARIQACKAFVHHVVGGPSHFVHAPFSHHTGETYPKSGQIVRQPATRRRLHSSEDAPQPQAGAPVLLAGITAVEGDELSDLLQD